MRVDQLGRRRRVLLAAAVLALPAMQRPGSALAAAATWNGDDATAGAAGDNVTWATAANWTTGAVDTAPTDVAPGDDLTFGTGTAGATIALGGNSVANTLTFNRTYTLGAAATTDTLTVATAPVAVSGGTTATINAVYAGGAGLALTGGGTLLLNRATGNTFTGNITVDGAGTTLAFLGTNSSADPTALGAGAKSITLTNGGVLQVAGGTLANPTGGSKSVVIGDGGGTIDTPSGQSLQLDDAGQFGGTGILTKTGPGTLIFDEGFTYTGAAVNINGGTIRVTNAGDLGATNVPINVAAGGSLDLRATFSGTKPINLAGTGISNGGALVANGGTGVANGAVTLTADASVGGSASLTLSGVVSGAFNLTKVGTGVTVLSNAANTYTGNTTIAGGAIRATAGTSLPTTGNLVLNGGAFETVANYAGTLGTLPGQVQLPGGSSGFGGGVAGGVTVSLNGAATTLVWGSTAGFSPSALVVNSASALGTMTFQNPIDLNGAARTFTSNSANAGIVAGVISNSGASAGVTVNGTGVTTFAAANTYAGTTTLGGGTLSIAADNNIPTGGPITFNGGVLRVTGTALTNFGSHAATFTNNAGAGVDVAAAGHTFTISQPVSIGTGGFTKAGAGTLTFAAGNNLTSSGTLTISGGGVLNLNQAADLSITSATTINGTGGTLNIAGGGRLVVNTSATDIGTGAGGTLIINPVIANGSTGNIDFFNSGGGTVVLTGANTWTGVTNIQNAIVSVASINSVVGGTASSNLGAPAAGNGTINIGTTTTGATLRYTGPGETTDRVVNLAGTTGGATLDASGTGLLRFTSNFTATGGGGKTLTLTGTGTGEVAGAIVNNSGTNVTTVTKTGVGTWTMSGASTYTGNTNVNGGTLVFANGASNSTTARLFLGVGGTSGAVLQRAGSTISVSPATGSTDVLGLGQSGGYGYYLNDGGSLTVGQLAMGGATSGANNTGVFEQNGGSTTVAAPTGYLITGWTGMNANGVLNIFAGTVNGNTPGQDIQMGFGANLNSFGMFNVLGPTAVFNATGAGTTRIVDLAKQAGNFAGVLNLNGGTTTANAVRAANTTSPSYLNFNGGTLRANVATTNFVNSLSAATIYAGGATIDSNGLAVTVPQALLAPTGSGLTAIPVATAGAGYIGAPAVRITGGGGNGATAIATVDLTVGSPTYGRVTGFTITSPGSGYTSTPTVTLVGGGATTAATPGTAATGLTPTTGGLTKSGAGTLTLTGANTYGGPTVVAAGTLALSRASTNSIPNSSTITVGDTPAASAAQLSVTGLTGGTLALAPGQTVGGHGSIVGALTAGRGTTVAPGTGIGTLSITGTLSTLAAGTGADPTYAAELAGGASTSSDRLQLTGTAAAGLLDLASPDVLNVLPLAAVGGTSVTYTIATFAGLGATGTQTFDSVLVNGAASQDVNPGAANYVLVTYAPGDGTTAGSGNIQVTVANLAAVPEPATAGLAGLAAFGLLARRRRHRRPA